MVVDDHRYAPASLPPGRNNGVYCTGGWVGARAGLDGSGEEEVSCTHQGLNRPSLYRLRCPSPLPFKLKSSAQIVVTRGCQNER